MTVSLFKAVRRAGLACAAAALVTSPAAAGVIYSDFGPGGSYNLTYGYAVSGASSASELGMVAVASGFTAGVSAEVSQIDLAVYDVSGTATVDVSLWTDSGGVPGSPLGSWSATIQPVDHLNQQAPTIVSGITGVNLVAGQTYFVELNPGAADTYATWQDNPTQADGLFWSTFFPEGSSSLPTQAFSVLSAPEPAAWALMIAGLGLTGAALRHRRRGAAPA